MYNFIHKWSYNLIPKLLHGVLAKNFVEIKSLGPEIRIGVEKSTFTEPG